jgi:hypothetical protein
MKWVLFFLNIPTFPCAVHFSKEIDRKTKDTNPFQSIAGRQLIIKSSLTNYY